MLDRLKYYGKIDDKESRKEIMKQETYKSAPALEFIASIPSDRWVHVRSSKQGLRDIASEYNRRHSPLDHREWVILQFEESGRAGWVKTKRIYS